jgi:hypothetical protein
VEVKGIAFEVRNLGSDEGRDEIDAANRFQVKQGLRYNGHLTPSFALSSIGRRLTPENPHLRRLL